MRPSALLSLLVLVIAGGCSGRTVQLGDGFPADGGVVEEFEGAGHPRVLPRERKPGKVPAEGRWGDAGVVQAQSKSRPHVDRWKFDAATH